MIYIPLSVLTTLYSGGKTKITNFDIHVVPKEQVTELKIPVDYVLVMEVDAADQNLVHVITSFRFSQSLASLMKLH